MDEEILFNLIQMSNWLEIIRLVRIQLLRFVHCIIGALVKSLQKIDCVQSGCCQIIKITYLPIMT